MHASMKFTIKLYSALILVAAFLILSKTALAAEYVPLVGLPQVEGQGQGLAAYFNRLYMAIVAVGAIIAFLKIAFAGVKYSVTGIVTQKEDAKNDIKGALLGLAILLIPFVVLNTIYPNLTSLNILSNARSIGINTSQSGQQSVVSPGSPTGMVDGGSAQTYTTTTSVRRYTQNQLGCTRVSDPQTGELPPFETTYVCDTTAARADCTSVNGDFRVTSTDPSTGLITASCTFIEMLPPSNAACALGGPC